MKKLSTVFAALGLAAVVAATPARADTVSFTVFQNAGGADTSSLNISLDITLTQEKFFNNITNYVNYQVKNLSNDGSSIIGVYLESQLGSYSNNVAPSITQSGGVNLAATGNTPPIANWAGNYVGREAASASAGLNTTSKQLTAKQLNTKGATKSQIISDLSNVGSRVAVLVSKDGDDVWMLTAPLSDDLVIPLEGDNPLNGGDEGNPNGGGETGGETPVVPVPAALWPGLALIGGLILRRRRL